jgi:DNA 3'-phosphatase
MENNTHENLCENVKLMWCKYGSVVIGTTNNFYNVADKQISGGSNKIMAFDLDDTIIKTKSGKFPISADDWLFCFDKKKIEQYKFIVIFTNQLNIKKQPKRYDAFKSKIINIISLLNCEVQIFISTEDDKFRKPSDILFLLFKQKMKMAININIRINFDITYVGDAYTENNYSDLEFAINSKIKFMCPLHFADEKSGLTNCLGNHINNPPNFGIQLISEGINYDKNIMKIFKRIEIFSDIENKSMVILKGRPSSGKSYVANYFKLFGYYVIGIDTNDELINCNKLEDQTDNKIKNEIINNKYGIVIDGCNVDNLFVNSLIEIGQSNNYKCSIIEILNDTCMCRWYSIFNEKIIPGGKKRYSKEIFSIYAKKQVNNKTKLNDNNCHYIQFYNYPNLIYLKRSNNYEKFIKYNM